jgi:hypothetical protein
MPANTASRQRSPPRSLNGVNRRRRLQDIEQSNVRLLRKLQERKSDYEVERMRRDWKKQKEVIKNISNYPVTIFSNSNKKLAMETPRGLVSHRLELEKLYDVNKTYEISRVKVIDWYTFHVVARLDKDGLAITANNSNSRDLKVIEIERG